jgi:CTP:molybdopterin cytidylyltransferase MocA
VTDSPWPSGLQIVVLAGGRSERMGFHKLVEPFAGEPLARRLVLSLRDLAPLVVATPAVADTINDLRFARLIVTKPTPGPSATLALAHAALPYDRTLVVMPADLPFLDGEHVRAFVARVAPDVDLAYPIVHGTPGHPVIWSPKARTRIPNLRDDEPPARVRRDPALRIAEMLEHDDAYITDVDTPAAWAAAEARALARER